MAKGNSRTLGVGEVALVARFYRTDQRGLVVVVVLRSESQTIALPVGRVAWLDMVVLQDSKPIRRVHVRPLVGRNVGNEVAVVVPDAAGARRLTVGPFGPGDQSSACADKLPCAIPYLEAVSGGSHVADMVVVDRRWWRVGRPAKVRVPAVVDRSASRNLHLCQQSNLVLPAIHEILIVREGVGEHPGRIQLNALE